MQSYTNKPNLSDVNIDCDLELGSFKLKGNIDYSASNEEINLSNRNLLGVNLFSCADFLGAIIASASDAVKKSITFTISGNQVSDTIRIPSNFVDGSVFRVIATAIPQTQTDYGCTDPGATYPTWRNITAYAGAYVQRVRNGVTANLGDVAAGTVISGNQRYLDVTGLRGGDLVRLQTITASSGSYWSTAQNNWVSFSVSSSATTLSIACDVANYASSGAVW